MSELLSIIDADDDELEVTSANNLKWQYPIDGFWSRDEPAEIQRLMRPRPWRYVGSRTELNEITLSLGVMGHDRGTIATRIEALRWRTDPDRGEFTLKRTTSNGNVRHIKVIRTGYEVDRQALALSSNLVPVTIRCKAADSVFYDPTPITVSGQFNGATPVNIAYENSNVDTYIEITVNDAVVNPRFEVGDDHMMFSGELVAGDELYADFRPESDTFGATLTHSGVESDWTGRRDSTSTWWELPGSSGEIGCSAASGDGTIVITFTKYYKVPY